MAFANFKTRQGNPQPGGDSTDVQGISFAELANWLGWEIGDDSGIGIHMTRKRMLEIPAVWAAVDFLAGTLASIPLLVRPRSDVNAKESSDPETEALLNMAATDCLTAYRARRAWVEDCLIEGRGLLYIERRGTRAGMEGGQPINLMPLSWYLISTARTNDPTFSYKYVANYVSDGVDEKERVEYGLKDVAELVMVTANQLHRWESPRIRMSRALGLSYFIQDYALRFFQGGGVPQVAFMTNIPAAAKASAFERFVLDMQKTLLKLKRARSSVLPVPGEVGEVKPLGFKPDDGQMADSRLFQIQEVCRIYGLPPVFLQDLSKGTFANVAQQDLHLVKHSLSKWIAQLNQELTLKLYGRDGDNCVKADVKAILRGDYRMRTEANRAAMQAGAITPNEWRDSEDREPLEGNWMNETWMPMNYAPLSVERTGSGSGAQGNGQGPAIDEDAAKDLVAEAMANGE